MTMKKMAAACAAAAMLATMGAANAQMNSATPMTAPPGAMMAPGGAMPGGAMMAPGGSMTTTQTTQQTTMGADSYGADSYAGDNSTLPNTGGEPLLMMMAGTLLAGSAFALRRKLS